MLPARTGKAVVQPGATSTVLIKHVQAAADAHLPAVETAAAPSAAAVVAVVEAAAEVAVGAVAEGAAEGADQFIKSLQPSVGSVQKKESLQPSVGRIRKFAVVSLQFAGKESLQSSVCSLQ